MMDDTATVLEDEAPAADEGWTWAILEVFGHRRHVGRAREEEKFGSKLCRIDVPKLGPAEGELTWSSHYYGGSSIFSFTPTDEKTVMITTMAAPDLAALDDPAFDDIRTLGRIIAAIATCGGIAGRETLCGGYLRAEGFSDKEIADNLAIGAVILRELHAAGIVTIIAVP